MSLLVENATQTLADQNIDNVQVILAVLEQTVFHFSLNQTAVILPVIEEVFACNLMLRNYSHIYRQLISLFKFLI